MYIIYKYLNIKINKYNIINKYKKKIIYKNIIKYIYNKYINIKIKKNNIFNIKIKFKYNYKYTISLLYNLKKLITLSSKNNYWSKISKKNKYSLILIFIIKCLNKYELLYKNISIYFFFKNFNIQTIYYLKHLYKLLKIVNVSKIFGFYYNLNKCTYPNRLFKKIKTIKKFKKKIFLKLNKLNLENLYKK